MKCKAGVLDGGISKFFPEDVQKNIISDLSVYDGDVLFIIGD